MGMFYAAKSTLFKLALEMKLNPTDAEACLWDRLRNSQILGHRFRRQHPIANYIVDFYCHKLKLVIEVDGSIHGKPENMEYDIDRDKVMQEFGLTILRFNNDEVLESTDVVISQIIKIIEANSKTKAV
jgi:very-short-patch-repair endonuclease